MNVPTSLLPFINFRQLVTTRCATSLVSLRTGTEGGVQWGPKLGIYSREGFPMTGYVGVPGTSLPNDTRVALDSGSPVL